MKVKRIVSVAIVLCMLLSLLPSVSIAAATTLPTTLYVDETVVIENGQIGTTSGTGWSFDSETATLTFGTGTDIYCGRGSEMLTTCGVYCEGDLKVVMGGNALLSGTTAGLYMASGSLDLLVTDGSPSIKGQNNANGIKMKDAAGNLSVEVAENAVLDLLGTLGAGVSSSSAGVHTFKGKGTVNAGALHTNGSAINASKATVKIDGITMNCTALGSSYSEIYALNLIVGETEGAFLTFNGKEECVNAPGGNIGIYNGSTVTVGTRSGTSYVSAFYTGTTTVEDSTIKLDTLAGTTHNNYAFRSNLVVSGNSHIVGSVGETNTNEDRGLCTGKLTVNGNYYYRTDSSDVFENNNISAKSDISYFELIMQDHTGYDITDQDHALICGDAECIAYTQIGEIEEHIFDDLTGTCMICGAYQAPQMNGDIYEIANASQLFWLAQQINTGRIDRFSAKLVADIVLPEGVEWTPIVVPDNPNAFSTFDGGGHFIDLGEQSGGLFKSFNYATIKDLTLYGSITANGENVGAVVGSAYRTLIENVISYVDVANPAGNAGGLAGYFGGKHDPSNGLESKIRNCAVYADISGINAGGFVGMGWNGTQYYDIAGGAYVGNVTAVEGGNAGAIVGYQATDTNTSTFSNIYWCETDGIGFYGKRDTANQTYINTEAKSSEAFASGEVAYLLNENQGNLVWYQTCGEDLPALSGECVYLVLSCDGVTPIYRNVDENLEHELDEDGFCSLCSSTYVASLNGTFYETLEEAWLAANTLASDGVDDLQLVLHQDATLLHDYETSVGTLKEGTVFTIEEGVTLTVDHLIIRDELNNYGIIRPISTASGDNSIGLNYNNFGGSGSISGDGEFYFLIYCNGGVINGGTFHEPVRGVVQKINGGVFLADVITTVSDGEIYGGTFQDIYLEGGILHYDPNAVAINGAVYDFVSSGKTTINLNGEAHTHALGETSYRRIDDQYHYKLDACTTCPFELYVTTKEEHSYENGYCICGEVEKYMVMVDGIRANSENCEDLLGDGTVSYDPATNTLTLNNASITDGCLYKDDGSCMAVAIISEVSDMPLNIHLIGENYVASAEAPVDGEYAMISTAIYSLPGVNFSGDGKLTVACGKGDFAYAMITTSLSVTQESHIAAQGVVYAFEHNIDGTFDGIIMTQDAPARYEAYGNAVLTEDLTVDGTNDAADTYGVFTICQDATLTVADGVTLRIADATNLTGSAQNLIENNGTVILEGTGIIVNEGVGSCADNAKHCYHSFKCVICGKPEEAPLVDGVYRIATAGQLYWFADLVNSGTASDADAILVDDIIVNQDLTADNLVEWTPIGNDVDFNGTFDGNGHCISGLYMKGSAGTVGFIGTLYDGSVTNLGIINSYFETDKNSATIGGVVASNYNSVSKCYFDGTVISHSPDVYGGGVVGYNGYEALTEHCYNLGDVYNYYDGAAGGVTTIGGVVGHNFGGTVKNCYNAGTVNNSGGYNASRVGMIVGCNFGFNYGSMGVGYALTENCYSVDGDVSLIGYSGTTNSSKSNIVTLYGDDVASGRLAYMLDDYAGTSIWGQTIGTDDHPVIGGAKVYEVTACDGYSTAYSNTNTDGSHFYGDDNICEYCGEAKPDYNSDKNLKFNMNIAIGAEMVVNYNFMASTVAKYEDFYLEVKKNVVGGEPIITTYGIGEGHTQLGVMNHPTTGEALLYNASYNGINAKEMGDTFETTLYAIDANGTVYRGETVVRSIKEFMMGKLNDAKSSDELKTMAVDMLRYGEAAQHHFAYDTENLVTNELTEEHLAYATKELQVGS